VTEWSDRVSRALKLLNSNFTPPFRFLVLAGLMLSPFLPRIRWLKRDEVRLNRFGIPKSVRF
jgi:hypothetical protein